MTPKQKCDELVNKYYAYQPLLSKKEAKIFALICCNEVLGYMGADRGYAFWESVKQEIEKL